MTGLPSGWVETVLGDVAEVNPRPPLAVPDDQQVSFVPMAALEAESGRLDATETATFGELRAKSYRQFEENDVIIAKITPSMENGKAAVARGLISGRAFGSTEFHVLRTRCGVDPTYLLHYVLQRSFRADAARQMTGTAGQLRVPVGYLRGARIPLAPTAEQHRIVAAIEEQFSRLDAGVASLQRAKRNLARMRASVLSAAVEGRLVEPDGEWAAVTVRDVASSIDYGSSAKASADLPGGIPMLRMGNIAGGRIDYRDLKFLPLDHPDTKKCSLAPGDVLFNRTNSAELVGKTAVFDGKHGPAAFASYLVRVRVTDAIEPSFLAGYINSTQGRAYIASVRNQQVGQANVNASKLAAMPIPLPPRSQQQRIVAELDRQFSILDAMEATVSAAQTRAERLRQSILREAFAGRLVPQDPADESASVLLEQIRVTA